MAEIICVSISVINCVKSANKPYFQVKVFTPDPEYVVRQPQKPVASPVLNGDALRPENKPINKQPIRLAKNAE